jgi:hypothetical protein
VFFLTIVFNRVSRGLIAQAYQGFDIGSWCSEKQTPIFSAFVLHRDLEEVK